MNPRVFASCAAVLCLLGGCTALRTATAPPPSFYSLDKAGARGGAVAVPSSSAPTLMLSPPHGAAGFDSPRMLYLRQAHQREYFAHSEWVDTPARMLAPLMVAALANSGAFRAVVLTPSAANGELRLDTEILRLEQDFATTPSRVHFTLRAWLVTTKSRRVVAWRDFDESAPAETDDPRGGVLAANRAVQGVLASLAGFCADAAGQWQREAAISPGGQGVR